MRLAWLACSRLHAQLGNAEAARTARHQAYALDIPPRDPLAPVRLLDLTDFYTNGHQESIPVRYAIEGFPWDWDSTPANPSTVVAWRGANPARQVVNLYCTTWTNPHPDTVVATIDLESAMNSCAPFIVSITVE